jgi:FkbM family methyltransferase
MIVVDVGANSGVFSRYILEKQPQTNVIAVEPLENLHGETLRSIAKCYPNFEYVNVALGNKNKVSKIYGYNLNNGQLASLLEINPDGNWNTNIKSFLNNPGNDDFQLVHEVTPKKFCKNFNLSKIDFLKIDVQGLDLLVLDKFLEIAEVKSAVVELNSSAQGANSRYKNENNTLLDLLKILEKHKMIIVKLLPNSSDCDEYNVFIAKSFESFSVINRNLDILNCGIFSRYSKIIGIGEKQNTSNVKLATLFKKKVMQGMKHPGKSIRSVVIKLVS